MWPKSWYDLIKIRSGEEETESKIQRWYHFEKWKDIGTREAIAKR